MFQDSYQYTELSIKNINFEKIAIEKFSKKQIPESYTYFKPAAETENIKIISSLLGMSAPTIIGNNYQNQMRADSINFRGKVTLLDFWYKSCYPCLKAIPALEKLRNKYDTGKLQIIGINHYDNTPAGIKSIPKFLEFNPIN